MKRPIFLFIASLFFTQAAQATCTPIKLDGNKGYAPFFIDAERDTQKGIFYDIANKVFDCPVQSIDLPESRRLISLKNGASDTLLMAKEWIDKPQEFAFSEPLFKVKDKILMRSENQMELIDIKDLIGKTVIVRQGYTYPMLSELFSQGKIKRIDAKTEKGIVKMLHVKRAKYAVINEAVGAWIIKENPKYQNTFTFSQLTIGKADMRFMFSKQISTKKIKSINKKIIQLQKSGELQRILSNYM